MNNSQSDKKIFANSSKLQKISRLTKYFVGYYSKFFKVYRKDNTPTAVKYVQGLIVCEKGKANMERMEEEIPDSEYRLYQHFISNSKWDYKGLISSLAYDASVLFEENKRQSGKPTGYIIDESAHLKKGDKSVGVTNQYAGVAGKIDNCQVGVYASLVNATRATIINAKLFLPKCWTGDKQRCIKADIPKESRKFQTKPQLALSMIDEDIANGVKFDWIGGDGLYGHNFDLTSGLDERELFFVLDVHKDERIYLQKPEIKIPPKKGTKGRTPFRPQPEGDPMRLDKYKEGLSEKDWTKIKVRKTAKGWLRLKVHVARVWVWNQENGVLKQRTLIISKTIDKKPDVKYSFSNGELDEYPINDYAYFQAQRYWVERTFDDAKNELGLSDYQIRKWTGWYHHNSLVIMASLFLTREKISNEKELPLMSMRDARILMIVSMFGTPEQQKERIKQMKKRHKKRQQDIDRRFRYQEIEDKLLES